MGKEIIGWEYGDGTIGYNADVSGQEIVGDDLEAILAGHRRARAGANVIVHPSMAAARQVARPIYASTRPYPAPSVRPLPPPHYAVAPASEGEMRELPVGFDSVTNVTKSTSTKLTQRPQVLFRPERLSVDDTLSAFFTIDDLKVGNKSQLISSGSLPASTFSSKAFGMRLKMDTCDPAIDLVLSVTNFDSTTDHRFLATVLGPALSK